MDSKDKIFGKTIIITAKNKSDIMLINEAIICFLMLFTGADDSLLLLR